MKNQDYQSLTGEDENLSDPDALSKSLLKLPGYRHSLDLMMNRTPQI
jgi:hypothetical protein